MSMLARTSAGLVLWALGFSLLYALQGAGCAYGWEEVALLGTSMLRAILVGTWLLLVGACLAMLRLARSASCGFEKRVTLATTTAGAVAMLVTGSPAALTAACG